jgi:hypothetical protein
MADITSVDLARLASDNRVLRPRRLHRRCPAPLPYAAGPGSRTGLDLRFFGGRSRIRTWEDCHRQFYRPLPILA